VRKLPILLGALAVLPVPGFTADDPVAVRQALMRNNGSAAAVAAAVMKGELAYSPVTGRAVIAALGATAAAYGDFFPEGSGDDPRTEASPKIWEDMPAFQAELNKFQTAVAGALEASGKDGPPDAAAFTSAMKPVLGTCKGCHETFRVDKD